MLTGETRTRRPGPAVRPLLIALLPAVAFGCHSAARRREGPAQPEPISSRGKADPGLVRTDLTPDIGPRRQVKLHLDLGRAHEAQGRPEAALAEYQQAIAVGEKSGWGLGDGRRPRSDQMALAHRRLAAALDRLGRFAEAEAHYRKALKLDPDDPKVWNDAGYSYYLQGRHEDAVRSLKTAAKLSPDDPRVQTNLGLALAASGKEEEALAALTRAGGSAVAHANLGYLLAATGRGDRARRHYEEALRLQPQLDAARVALAKLDGGKPSAAQVAASPSATDVGIRRASQ